MRFKSLALMMLTVILSGNQAIAQDSSHSEASSTSGDEMNVLTLREFRIPKDLVFREGQSTNVFRQEPTSAVFQGGRPVLKRDLDRSLPYCQFSVLTGRLRNDRLNVGGEEVHFQVKSAGDGGATGPGNFYILNITARSSNNTALIGLHCKALTAEELGTIADLKRVLGDGFEFKGVSLPREVSRRARTSKPETLAPTVSPRAPVFEEPNPSGSAQIQ